MLLNGGLLVPCPDLTNASPSLLPGQLTEVLSTTQQSAGNSDWGAKSGAGNDIPAVHVVLSLCKL